MHCECDFDCVGDPPHYTRANHSTLCPIHDKCCWCDERLAVVIDQGDKLCRECLDELQEEDRKRQALLDQLKASA
jgi:hypothetical protein